jgi:hypothetical protein
VKLGELKMGESPGLRAFGVVRYLKDFRVFSLKVIVPSSSPSVIFQVIPAFWTCGRF